MVKSPAGSTPLAYSSPEAVQTTGTVANRLFSGVGFATARDFPPINIWLGDNSVVVTAELPGVSHDDVTLNLQDDVLTLEGKREPGQQQENSNWQRRERSYG